MTAAAVPKTSHVAFSQVSTRRTHGLHSLRQTNAPRSMRRGLTRLNNSRLILGQREQQLDSSRIRVIDGDTFAYGAERIRIQGFDAAERSDAGGFEATERLEVLLRHGQVTMIPKATDIYGRIVAQIFVDRHNVADLLEGAPLITH
jgi:endonuclease YncB( thermonuclease family)